MANFNFNGRISATFRIRNQTYTLTSDADLTGQTNIRLVYRQPFDQAMVVGTIGEIFNDLVTLQGWGLSLAGVTLDENNLSTQLTELLEQAKRLPGFGNLMTGAESVKESAEIRGDLRTEFHRGQAAPGTKLNR